MINVTFQEIELKQLKMRSKVADRILKKTSEETKKKSSDAAKKTVSDAIALSKSSHAIWHKFSNWLIKNFGKDLYGEWVVNEIKNEETGKILKMRYRDFNEFELSKRLVGYDVMTKIEKFVKRSCPEIRICRCDDSIYAGSDILLIPHPKHGITMMFIPQCTSVQNQMFLYDNHCKNLIKELTKMQKVYKCSI